eukprot:CAMPEP_0114612628 /NCGR_PEP_ID=MMETSP0168-20121206/4718_1 /TAXON_ID=95228 ORGANISM="Vannella sp., Strain DIVA3 517/6/12" /NCGR_SAMPLE_ID=MMETSP0168 /ASSEMBLY_ACC=CAM_ASM_000044 /LENGTH=1002 /DNA_ID=CAMNT_0001823615 /DNA_START=214 /DNA_END=3223 /DNA_ORIENTATION=+
MDKGTKKRLMGHRHTASLSDMPRIVLDDPSGSSVPFSPPSSGFAGGYVFEEPEEASSAPPSIQEATAKFSEEYAQYRSFSKRISVEMSLSESQEAREEERTIEAEFGDWVFCDRIELEEAESSGRAPENLSPPVQEFGSVGGSAATTGDGSAADASVAEGRASRAKRRLREKLLGSISKEVDMFGSERQFFQGFKEREDFLECYFGPVSWSGMKYAKRWVVLEESAVVAYLPAVVEQKKGLFSRWKKQTAEEEEAARKEAEEAEDRAADEFQYETIDLTGCTVSLAKKETGKKVSFMISRPSPDPEQPPSLFFFKPANMEDCLGWVADVQTNIDYSATSRALLRKASVLRLSELSHSHCCDSAATEQRSPSFVLERDEEEEEEKHSRDHDHGHGHALGHSHGRLSILAKLQEMEESPEDGVTTTLEVEDLQGGVEKSKGEMTKADIRQLDRQLKKQLTKHPEDSQRIITDFMRMVLVFDGHPIGKVYADFVNGWKEQHYFTVYTATSNEALQQSVQVIKAFITDLVRELLSYYPQLTAFQKSACHCYAVIEQQLFTELHKFIFLMYKRLYEPENLATLAKTTEFASITPAHLGVRQKFWLLEEAAEGLPYQRAVNMLRTIQDMVAPSEKLDCLVSTARCICDCVSVYYKRQPDVDADSIVIGGDDMLPLFAYVMIKSGLSMLVSEAKFIEDFVSQKSRYSEGAYFLVTFHTALALIGCLTVETMDNWTKLGLEESAETGAEHNSRWSESVLAASGGDYGGSAQGESGGDGMVKRPSTHSFLSGSSSLDDDGRGGSEGGRVKSFGFDVEEEESGEAEAGGGGQGQSGGDAVDWFGTPAGFGGTEGESGDNGGGVGASFSPALAENSAAAALPAGLASPSHTRRTPVTPVFDALKFDSTDSMLSSVGDDFAVSDDDEEEEDDDAPYAKVAKRPRSISACSDSSLQDIDLDLDAGGAGDDEKEPEVSFVQGDENLGSFVGGIEEERKTEKFMLWARSLIKKGDKE